MILVFIEMGNRNFVLTSKYYKDRFVVSNETCGLHAEM